MPQTMTLVRGLPGSGKTNFAEQVVYQSAFSADDFFIGEDGFYNFDVNNLGEAHEDCLNRVSNAIRNDVNVVVHNTFSCRWEMQPYFDLQKRYLIRIYVVDLYDGGCNDTELMHRNSHDVPLDTIKNMRERWEHDWKKGNPVKPWER